MELEVFFLSVVSVCAMISYIPQIIKSIRTKSTGDVSLSAYIISLISFIFYLLYATICSDSPMLIFETSLETFLCVFLIILIIIFGKRKKK